ncbi:ABC transporter substrate-binding protein [Promicromonospora thailandica]|uniref:Multiple sugar transport system substrate-binding protein n=1 Tax=Promicromonospora thailandica TaxID=765201 RepID=A0A9X2G5E6_9MICO|nr:extracellular solute-binding protein [Promicromonospora thailandica]MCP2267412.1 multiple sugar transport system substrate-binding protein [Promicromonospora thailandica]BFF19564.1 extracellular solute-binding protein [Promicromonospora thailandica]
MSRFGTFRYDRAGAVRRTIAASAAAAAALTVTACGSGGPESDGVVTVWTVETQPERLAVQQEAMDAWAADAGVETELVPVEEDQVSQLLSAAALSGDDMPDVVNAISPGLVRSFDRDGYLDRDAAAEVVEALGEDTFTSVALDLTSDDGELLAVPSDAWPMMVYYRTDLFEEAGLEPPTTYDALRTAAEELTTDGRYGITLSTDAADPFTQQTLEFLAQGNGCELVDDAGEATLDSPACTETIELYGALAADFSPDGTEGVESTRASYFAGQAAMTVWSSFLLDELAGLREEFTPSCDECTEDPGWLAEHTAVVPVVEGPSAGGDAAGYVELVSWGITDGADPETTDLVEYMMSDAYVDWLSMAPEGKVPVRTGTADDPAEYTDAWSGLQIGVDQRVTFSDVWPTEVTDTLAAAPESANRWALPQGQGAVLGPLTSELPLAKAAADLGSGSTDAAGAQSAMQEAVSEIVGRD